jgi:hypothetical protein
MVSLFVFINNKCEKLCSLNIFFEFTAEGEKPEEAKQEVEAEESK